MVDHFSYDTLSSSDKHDVLLLPQPSTLRPDVRDFFVGDGTLAFPRAVAQELGNNSPLLAPILQAQSTAYSYNPKDEVETVEDPFAVGDQISLVSSMQARNSARFTVFGSAEALENTWFDAKVKDLDANESKTANREFAKQISAWTFMELGVLKVGRVEHHLSSILEGAAGNDSVAQLGYLNPPIYRVKNDVVRIPYPLILLHMLILNYRLSTLSSPSTCMIISYHSKFILQTLSSLSLPCFPHSTASTFNLSLKH